MSKPWAALKDAAKKLPVLKEPAAQRVLAAFGVASRTCERCAHWDHEAGQRAMQAHAPFAQAAQYLTPAQMGRPPRLDEDSPPAEPEGEEKKVRLVWADFGACAKHQELRAKSDTCSSWT